VEIGAAAAEFDCGFQDYDGRGAIDIVVTIDQDSFFALNSRIETIDSRFHSSHQVWRVKVGE
jgi:hypothetical protein